MGRYTRKTRFSSAYWPSARCTLHNLEKAAKDTFETYRAAHLVDQNTQTFKGVQLERPVRSGTLVQKEHFCICVGTRASGSG